MLSEVYITVIRVLDLYGVYYGDNGGGLGIIKALCSTEGSKPRFTQWVTHKHPINMNAISETDLHK